MEIYVKQFGDYFVLTTCKETPSFLDKDNDTDIRNMLYREIIYLATQSFDIPQNKAIDKFITLAKEHHCKLIFSSWKLIIIFSLIQDAEDMKKEIESRIILNRLHSS